MGIRLFTLSEDLSICAVPQSEVREVLGGCFSFARMRKAAEARGRYVGLEWDKYAMLRHPFFGPRAAPLLVAGAQAWLAGRFSPPGSPPVSWTFQLSKEPDPVLMAMYNRGKLAFSPDEYKNESRRASV